VGFVESNGAYSTVSIAGAAATILDYISNSGVISGEIFAEYNSKTGNYAIDEGFIGVPK
jgi:hypothetical protein